MNPDYDFTLNSSESSTSGEARNRFLETLGMGESALRRLEEKTEEMAKADEGLVLTSQPDIEAPESSIDLTKGRTISISVNRGTAVNRSLEISLPTASKGEGVGAPDVKPSVTPVVDDLDTIINLSCPECAGDLVIKRRHLGVEGACVWCHTPIVAAETARDRQVRVFPILGGIQKTAAPVTPPVQERCESSENLLPAPVKPLETKEDPSLACTPETAWSPAVLPSTPVVADSEASSNEGNFGFAPSFEPALRNEVPAIGESANEELVATEGSMPMDLEDLYASTGFGAPAEEATDEPGFGETLANTATGMPGFNPAGFGAFLQSPTPPSEVERKADQPASPWSGSGNPSFENLEPPADFSPILDEAAPAVAGFSSPSPWGPPISLVPDETVIDAPPTRITEETPLSDWASAFENPPQAEDSASTPKDTAPETLSPAPAPAGFSGFTGFESAFGASSAEPKKADPAPASGDAPSGFFFNSAPASTTLFGRSEGGEASFAVPGHCFSTGSSSEPEPKTFEALFPSASEEGTRSSIFEASEPDPNGPGTALFDAGEEEPHFPSIKQGTSLFGDSPFVSFQDEPATETSQAPAQGQVSSFSDFNAAPVPPPVAPEILPAPSPSAPAIPSAPSAPAIPTLPLATKPKPKVRKGFLVLMVIIVGFASGAALASFVLPVDEYVQTARAFMEKKFNPAGITPQTQPDPIPTGSDAPPATPAP